MWGKGNVSGALKGSFTIDLQPDTLKIRILKPAGSPPDRIKDLLGSKNNILGGKIAVKGLTLHNKNGESFKVKAFRALISKIIPASLSTYYNDYDLIIESSEQHSYSIYEIRPEGNLIYLKSNAFPRDSDKETYHNFFLYRIFHFAKMPVHHEHYLVTIENRQNGFAIEGADKSISDSLRYAIAILQGILPSPLYTVHNGAMELNLTRPLAVQAQFVNIIDEMFSKEKKNISTKSLANSEKWERLQRNYLCFYSEAISLLVYYLGDPGTSYANKLRKAIELYTEAISISTFVENKLAIIFTTIESLSYFLPRSPTKVDTILNAIELTIKSSSDEERNSMLRRLRNGIVHYANYSAKLTQQDRQIFQDQFNSNISSVYQHLVETLNRFFLAQANII